MGLHPDVKKYIAERFPECVSESPGAPCQVVVCDYMWLLFKFFPDEFSRGEDLIDFIWGPIARFFDAGGETYVMCFDRPERVPRAKAEEHAKRYASKDARGGEELTKKTCDQESVPLPWQAALADRSVRKEICKFISEGALDRFLSLGYGARGKKLFSHGIDGTVRRASGVEKNTCPEHSAAAEIGEGDLSVGYWAGVFCDKVVVARVLDSDQIPILMLRCLMKKRTAACYVWLVSPTRPEREPEPYPYLPREKRMTFDAGKLIDVLFTRKVNAFEFVFMLICQKTDFVDKVIKNLGVGPSMRLSEKHFHGSIKINASSASCDPAKIERSLREMVFISGKKSANLVASADVELRRAWWNLLYWTFGADGPLHPALLPSAAYGFEASGFRPNGPRIALSFPTFENK